MTDRIRIKLWECSTGLSSCDKIKYSLASKTASFFCNSHLCLEHQNCELDNPNHASLYIIVVGPSCVRWVNYSEWTVFNSLIHPFRMKIGFSYSGRKCSSPFATNYNKQYFSQLWSGLFKCDYDPDEDPSLVSKVGSFIRYFYMTGDQTTYQEVSVSDMSQRINSDYKNYIIMHGFTDGVKPGGIRWFSNIITKWIRKKRKIEKFSWEV